LLLSLTQLVGTLNNICKGRRSNLEYPTYSSSKCEFITSKLLNKKTNRKKHDFYG